MNCKRPLMLMTMTAAAHAAGQAPPGYALAPGFPVSTQITNWNGGMMVNLDADPELEFVASAGPEIWAFNIDGSVVSGWPVFTGDPSFGPPSWGDVDGDGENEIVFTTFFFGLDALLIVLEKDGSVAPGFPVVVSGAFKSNSLADLDGDGTMELFKDNSKAANPNESFNHDGTPLAGWEFPNHDGYGQMEFGDIDNDGFMDFIAPVNNATTVMQTNRFFLYKSTTVPYSPESAPVGTYMYNYKRNGQVFFSPTDCRADVNGDGQVTPTDFSAWINAYNNNLPECDQNGDNQCTPTDFSAWINNYNAGC